MYTAAELRELQIHPKINDITLQVLREFYYLYLHPFIYTYTMIDHKERNLELRFDIENFCHLVGIETIVRHNINRNQIFNYKGLVGWNNIENSLIDFCHLKNINKVKFKSVKAKFVYFYLIPKLISLPSAVKFSDSIVVLKTDIKSEMLFYDNFNNAIVHLGIEKSYNGDYYIPRTFFIEKVTTQNTGYKYIDKQSQIDVRIKNRIIML